MKEALAQSLNIPAIKTLYLAGIDNMLKATKNLGINTLTERSRYGLSLVLGGGEVKLIELVGAYSVLSQDGVKHKQQIVLRIEEQRTGKTVEEYKSQATRVVESQHARLINNILSDIDLRRPLFSASLALTTLPNQEVALKTGTTNDYRDAWAVGYTPSFVVGVWAGNNDNAPMKQRGTSLLAAVPIWSAFMKQALAGKPIETFNQPDPVVIDKPALRGEIVINDQVHDILYYVDKKNPLGPQPKNPEEDGQFTNWEDPVIEWIKTNPIESIKNGLVGTGEAQALQLTIKNPVQGAFIKDKLTIDAEIVTTQEIRSLDVLGNDAPLDLPPFLHLTKTTIGFAYHVEIPASRLELQNKIVVRATDAQQRQIEKSVIVFK